MWHEVMEMVEMVGATRGECGRRMKKKRIRIILILCVPVG